MLPRIGLVSTFPPTECGIAIFSEALTTELIRAGATVGIVDLTADGTPMPVTAILHRHRGQADVRTTAHFLNSLDVAILQHEFGIWDGEDGDGIVALLGALSVPVITVLHTVPTVPTGGQRRALQRILDLSDSVVVLSHSGMRRVQRDYAVRPGSLTLIPHGALRRGASRPATEGAANRRILSWGLLGPGKGFEWGVRAVGRLRDRGIACEYVVAGATHPKVRHAEGEAYRTSLTDLADSLGVSDRLTLVSGYLGDRSLSELIASASIYLVPYDSVEQVTSGVLTEAVAAGGPVVATRFPHAVELLGNGAGVLVDHRDPQGIADAIDVLLRDTRAYDSMRAACALASLDADWPTTAGSYLDLAARLWRSRARRVG